MPRGRRIHSGYRGFTWVRLGVVGFIRVPVGSLGCVMGASDSLRFAWDNLGAPRGRRIHSGFTWEGQGVVGFIRISVGSLGRA